MRNFSARETEWLLELDGIELASFRQRAIALMIDGILLGILMSIVAGIGTVLFLWYRASHGHPVDIHNFVVAGKNLDEKQQESLVEKLNNEGLRIINDIVVPILYFGILLWKGKGRTPGKRIMRIRVVSLMHRHITLWHSIERALGYGAAALEGGFGFVQFFIHPYRRCAQDRLAETIVVTERGYQAMQHKLEHPLIPDGAEGEGLLSQ